MEQKKVWFVTGASKGLGLSLVQKLLLEGYCVVATSRNVDVLQKKAGVASKLFLPIQVDLTDSNDVKNAIAQSVAHFGKIDVVVNNAGYGQTGALEELSHKEVQDNFEVNVFAPLHVIRHAIPFLRTQKSGHIINISSVGGLNGGFSGWGIYCATKFAMAGFTEALAMEVEEFGVNTTIVYPGYFRTDFLNKNSVRTPSRAIEAYESARQSENLHFEQINGNQPNDPEKAAEVLIAISKEQNPPGHLLLGKDAFDMLNTKMKILTQEMKKWEEYTMSTLF